MPLEAALRDKILTSVAAGFAEQIAFTQALIRFPSVRGAELTCQDFVFRALRDRGYAMDRFSMDHEAIQAHLRNTVEGGHRLRWKADTRMVIADT